MELFRKIKKVIEEIAGRRGAIAENGFRVGLSMESNVCGFLKAIKDFNRKMAGRRGAIAENGFRVGLSMESKMFGFL